MLPRTDTIRTKKTNTCDCPVCAGLACQERPRYFAGQLLTETELNSEQAYTLLAKNRLHNRYLHGYGIVCGLQVSCHDCEGWVTVHPGYALDACGNDIIACQAQDFDLIKAIRACREEKRGECDPWREPVANRCEDVEENWCITIRYAEREGKPSTALVSCSPSTCGCDSGRKGRQCECGGKGHTATRAVSVRACEPSRIIESFELGVVPAPRRETGDKEESILQHPARPPGAAGDQRRSDLPGGVRGAFHGFCRSAARRSTICCSRTRLGLPAPSTATCAACGMTCAATCSTTRAPTAPCSDRLAQVYCPPPPHEPGRDRPVCRAGHPGAGGDCRHFARNADRLHLLRGPAHLPQRRVRGAPAAGLRHRAGRPHPAHLPLRRAPLRAHRAHPGCRR